ncbi:hypothetical protein F4775DRAFT_378426 [Biscogniauxia sp. FL1348]|nr:hypothetical protein F4775DRAFT_378426 [Biscogniauxia sp. FL1348]
MNIYPDVSESFFLTTLGKPEIAMKIEIRVAWRQCNTRDTVKTIMRKHRGCVSEEQKIRIITIEPK